MVFEFATAGRILFGPGTRNQLPDLAATTGQRILVVTGSRLEPVAWLCAAIAERGARAEVYHIPKEPTVDLARRGAEIAQKMACDLVVGYGGGSAIDAAKAIAALATNTADVYDYLEVVGKGLPLTELPLPCFAIPTTAGTGAEVTRNAVLASPEHQVKVSLRHPLMLPRLAIVDPELTNDLPPDISAATGLDALTQLIEPFVCNSPNPITDGICREGIPRIARSIRSAVSGVRTGRLDMALGSLFGGLALANAKLGAVHGFAGPLGGMFSSAPHGAVCGKLLPLVMRANLGAIRNAGVHPDRIARYDEIGRMLTGEKAADADAGLAWVEALCSDLSLPGLSSYGVAASDIPAIVEASKRASSMKGNPVSLSSGILTDILEEAMM